MSNLLEKINSFKGSSIISFDTVTNVTLSGGKKNPFQGRVIKITTGNRGMLFKNGNGYKNMVNRRLVKEGIVKEFEPGNRPWGTRVANSTFISHKGKMYLEVIFLSGGKSSYYVDGTLTLKNEIPGIKEQTSGEQDGLTNKVFLRVYAIESLLRIRMKKEEIVCPTGLLYT